LSNSYRKQDSSNKHSIVDWKPGDLILDLYDVLSVTEGFGDHVVHKDYHVGGFGRVYKVYHRAWNRTMAVKTPVIGQYITTKQKETFKGECETWINLGLHPNITPCHYVRDLDGALRVFSDYADAGSLADWINSRKLYEGSKKEILTRILDFAIQLARGLEYAHTRKVIHQDVKPSNALIWRDGSLKITDFGLAGARYKSGIIDATSETILAADTIFVDGAGAMTPQYCSPEQAAGDKLTRRTDIWSWAVTILEMFTGEATWQHGTAAGKALSAYLEQNQLRGEYVTNQPVVPVGVVALLERCFQVDTTKRPQSMAECAAVLEEVYLSETGDAYPRKELQVVGDTVSSLNNRALSLRDLGKVEEAMACLEEALALDRQHVAAVYNRALLRWRASQIDDLQVADELAELEINHPGDIVIKEVLGGFYLESGNLTEAKYCFEKAVALGAAENTFAMLEKIRMLVKEFGTNCLHTIEGHNDSVTSVAISSDGSHALSGSADNTLKLWKLPTGNCLRTFEGHKGSVNSVAISSNNRYALSGGHDMTLKLWDVATGKCLLTMESHAGSVNSVDLSLNGRHALTGSDDETLKLWELATGRCQLTFVGHAREIHTVSFTPVGQYCLSGGRGKSLKLWDYTNSDCLRKFIGHQDEINSLAVSNDGCYILSGSEDKMVMLWELSTGRLVRIYEGHKGGVNSVAFSPDGRYALTGSWDKTLKLWDLITARCLRTFVGHRASVSAVAFSPCGVYALSGSHDNTLKLWNVSNICVHQMKASYLYSMILSVEQVAKIKNAYNVYINKASAAIDTGQIADALRWISNARSHPDCVRLPEVLKLKEKVGLYCRLDKFSKVWLKNQFIVHPDNAINAVSFTPDGRYALTGCDQKYLRLWDLSTGICLSTTESDSRHIRVINTVAISPVGRYALSGSNDEVGNLKLWEMKTGSCLQSFEGHKGGVLTVAFSPDGRYALSGSNDETMKQWELTSGICIQSFVGHECWIHSVAFSPDGRYALSGSGIDDGSIKLWELSTGICLRTLMGHTSDVNCLVFSPCGHYALSGSNDEGHNLKLWELNTGRCLLTFMGHKGGVNSVAFTSDGRFAITSSYDKTLKLWDAATGQCLYTYVGDTSYNIAVSFTPNSRFCLSACSDNTLKIWELDWEYEFPGWADWDDGAEPYLANFLTLRKRKWNEEDFSKLLKELSYRGYGWLKAEGVRNRLEKMTRT
jgi:WD40 repeat protein/serine/threonine protein kinase